MKVYFEDGKTKVPIKSWCEAPEEGALEQARNLANLPFVFKHVALMPDTHEGYGMPIGGVIATEKVVIPNAVGVDIGCGMCAIKTPWTADEISTDRIKKIMGRIREQIPVGFGHNKTQLIEKEMPVRHSAMKIVDQEWSNARYQIGTLGGGNHFIEIQKDECNYVWVMLHSGSRNLGKKACDYYNSLAKSLNKQWHSGIPSNYDLAFLPLDTEFGQQYMEEMQYCVEFAHANRQQMMLHIAAIFNGAMKWKKVDLQEMINIAHNYASMENHFGRNVLIHRKGATLARVGTIGIIPGSQGSASYIVKGLGNKESFESCSHGAGRKMGRKEAQKTLDLEAEKKKLDDLGIIHGLRNEKDLDEAAGAYKDIDTVMNEQCDLVEIMTKLSPMAVIKG